MLRFHRHRWLTLRVVQTTHLRLGGPATVTSERCIRCNAPRSRTLDGKFTPEELNGITPVDTELQASLRNLAEAMILTQAQLEPEKRRDDARRADPASYSVVRVIPYLGVDFTASGLTREQAEEQLPLAVKAREDFCRRVDVPSTNIPVVMPTGEAVDLHDAIERVYAQRDGVSLPPQTFEERLEVERQHDTERLQHPEGFLSSEERRLFLLSRGLYEPVETEEAAENAA